MIRTRNLIMLMMGVAIGVPAIVSAETGSAVGIQAGATQSSASVTAAAPIKEYDYGDYTSVTLTSKAWEAFQRGDYAAVDAFTHKCIDLFEGQAIEQSESLTDFSPREKVLNYWALNDVATSYFIRGQSLLAQGKVAEGKEALNTVIEQYPYAQAWDTKGWFWKVAEGASDKLSTIGTPYDYGDYTSSTLTTKAWQGLGKKDYKGVELYVNKSIQLYEEEALEQQGQLDDFASKEEAFDFWALNDVATGYFILGEALMAQERYKEAKAAFERVVNDFSYAQCWDPKGWFWKVAVGSRDRLNKILIMGVG